MIGMASLRRAARATGFDFHRYPSNEWSHSVEAYYPVDAVSRWGYGKPPHGELLRRIEKQRDTILSILSDFSLADGVFKTIQTEGNPDSTTPYWGNPFFAFLDAAALIAMLIQKKPKLYLEIGSGNSTKFVRHTIQTAKLNTRVISIDPEPRAQVNELCESVVRTRLEDCDLNLFDELESGDILFFDGSHRLFTNSDVAVFFLEVMPRLRPGVIVQIHDIFLPFDYPPAWKRRMYSEQYMLAAMMLCPTPPFRVLLPNCLVCSDPSLQDGIPSHIIPTGWRGGSFWIEMTSEMGRR